MLLVEFEQALLRERYAKRNGREILLPPDRQLVELLRGLVNALPD